MLEIFSIKSPEQKKAIFDNVDFNTSSWIVSNLISKFELQKKLLNESDIIRDDQILRIHDFWKTLLLKLKPKTRIISRECAAVFVRQNLKDINLEKEGFVEGALDYVEALVPFFTHPHGPATIETYFSDFPLAKKRWQIWYELAESQWKFFLEHEFTLLNWASAMLSNLDGFEKVWDRTLYFDLSSQIQPLEAQLILEISKNIDVKVIVPKPDWALDFKSTLLSYETLSNDLFKFSKKEKVDFNQIQFLRSTTQLGEVKEACKKVRQWLDQGVALDKIAVTAPDLSVYWPALSEYFVTEGIPFKRESRTTFLTFPDIHRWITRLKINKGSASISSGMIESALVTKEKFSILNFDNFESLYSKVYDRGDLKRDDGVLNYLAPHSRLEELLSKEEFIKWALTRWEPTDTSERVEDLVHSFYQGLPSELKIKVSDWVEILEQTAAKKDFEIEARATMGIECADLGSVHDFNVSHIFAMGLSDQALRKPKKVLIDDFDIRVLKENFGFAISHPESRNLEFELRWLIENRDQKFVLSFAQTDFDGLVLAPSVTWLLGGLASEHSNESSGDISDEPSNDTRFDQIMQAKFESRPLYKSWSNEHSLNMSNQIKRDLGIDAPETLQVMPAKLSPTSIEDYSRCPFIFTAKKMLHLSDLPDVDLDIDYMTRGRLLHAIFDKILSSEPVNLKISDADLNELIDQAKTETNFKVADMQLWKTLKQRYLYFSKRFIEFEADWRVKYPATNTLYKEKLITGYINADGALARSESEGAIPFSGKIDRIDVDGQKNAVVIDYKFNSASKNQFRNWISNYELQLSLYSIAIEQGWIDDINYEVVGAIYFSIKDFDRQKGFLVKEGGESLFTLNPRKRNIAAAKDKQELFKSTQEHLKTVLQKMRAGVFFSKPDDLDICKDCSWRKICRAPHLS